MVFEVPTKIVLKEPSVEKIYDAIIIGAGPAGMTAAVYCSRKKMDTLIITKDIGGQILWTSGIENYMGYRYISGKDLSDKFNTQIEQFPVALINYSEASSLEIPGDRFAVSCNGMKYSSRTVIVATGRKPRQLDVPGEKELVGRGVAYCSICDAPLFADMPVAVIGGGNSALTSAVDLIPYASKIYLVSINETIKGDPVLLEKVEKSGKSEKMMLTEVIGIKGQKQVEAMLVKNIKSQKITEVSLGGVFVEIGLEANTKFLNNQVELNKNGEILIDCNACTSVDGIFACGDVTGVQYKQIVIACGEGAKAALSAYKYIIEKK